MLRVIGYIFGICFIVSLALGTLMQIFPSMKRRKNFSDYKHRIMSGGGTLLLTKSGLIPQSSSSEEEKEKVDVNQGEEEEWTM